MVFNHQSCTVCCNQNLPVQAIYRQVFSQPVNNLYCYHTNRKMKHRKCTECNIPRQKFHLTMQLAFLHNCFITTNVRYEIHYRYTYKKTWLQFTQVIRSLQRNLLWSSVEMEQSHSHCKSNFTHNEFDVASLSSQEGHCEV